MRTRRAIFEVLTITTDKQMTIQTIADATSTTVRTIQRWVVKFNEQHNTDHSRGKNAPIVDHDLLQHIKNQGGVIDMRQVYHGMVAEEEVAFEIPKIEFETYEYPPASPASETAPKKYGFTQKFAFIDSNGEEHDLATDDNNNRTSGVSEASEIGPGDGVELPYIGEQPENAAQTHTADADATFMTKLINLLPVLPLPMLGLAASYGVYLFASQFVPTFVAVAEAAAFELIYIGLAALKGLSEERRKLARRVSIGAVIVSVIYNTLAGAIELRSDLLLNLHEVFFWVICIIHGAPLAVLAFYVSDLLFHAKDK